MTAVVRFRRIQAVVDTRVVGEQKPEGLTRQHGLVDGCDLVRERFHQRCVDRENGVEEVREADAVRLGYEPEELSVAVETPRSAFLDEF